MKKDNQRKIKKEQWKEMAKLWSSYKPPAKPSKNEIKFYEKNLKKIQKQNKDLKVLVLGATPEFRDLLSKYKINTTIVDVNPLSVKAMSSLLKRKNPKEKIVFSDWLNMSFEKNSFDVVFSDSAQDNIRFNEFDDFFRKIRLILKSDGIWFFGGVAVPRNFQISFENYLKLYKKYPDKFKDNRNYWLYIFQLCYNPKFYNKINKLFDFGKLDNEIRKLIKKGLLPKESIKEIGLGMDYQQVVISKEEFKKIISVSFNIKSEYEDKSHPSMKIKWTAVLKPKK
jgi:ubiquinone/menaquinone biosynthesis C-methylase UbiE